MDIEKLAAELEEALAELPILDAHTHLDATHLSARGLHDILLYHMVISDLYAAGSGEGARLSEHPDDAEAFGRLEGAVPFVARIANTSCAWGVRIILRDLYGWSEPVAPDNWRKIDAVIRERSGDGWAREVLGRARIRRSSTELWRRHDGRADDVLQYSLEWAFFTRAQWGEFDTPLYELERTWSQDAPSEPISVTVGADRPPTEKVIRGLDDVHDALDHYVAAIPFDDVLSSAQHLSGDINYLDVTGEQMAEALARRGAAGPRERDVYASYILEGFIDRLKKAPRRILFQFSSGAEPLPFETASRMSQQTLAQMARLIARHAGLDFQCHVASVHANQTLCTMARELPNFSLAGYWWHNFFPRHVEQVLSERLDMLPMNKQVGFFSDAYCTDWCYAKTVMVRRIAARVLARKIALGQLDRPAALAFAAHTLFDAPRDLCGMRPRQ